MMSPEQRQHVLDELLTHFARVMRQAESARCRTVENAPLELITGEFLANNWESCREGLLAKTRVLRVIPEPSPAPRVFRFELDRPYKRKGPADVSAILMPGPLRGSIHYRPDLFANPDGPHVAVQVDPELSFFHPNCSRGHASLVCLGNLPDELFPLPLDLLIETRLYPILTYQDRQPSQPLDLEAAAYFVLDPRAMDGLEPVEPLY